MFPASQHPERRVISDFNKLVLGINQHYRGPDHAWPATPGYCQANSILGIGRVLLPRTRTLVQASDLMQNNTELDICSLRGWRAVPPDRETYVL
jgi:hypothetical protein